MQMQLHWRFDAIAWGCLAWVFHKPLAEFWERSRHAALFAGALLAIAVAVSVPLPVGAAGRAGQYLFMAPVFAALVTALAFAPGAWLTRAFAWAPLAFIGIISYEIYLTHVVVYRVIERTYPRPWIGFQYAVSMGWRSPQVGSSIASLANRPNAGCVIGYRAARRQACARADPGRG